MEKFNPLLVDNMEDTLAEADPVIQAALAKREAALLEITRNLQGVTFAGTESRQEQEELESNMASLIADKTHSYKYIEQLLVALGYNLNKVRYAFKKLTGLSHNDFLNPEAYVNTPPMIPQFNYGWGESKDSQFNFYFIMPHAYGYGVFGQAGDINREVVKYVLSLDEAMDFIDKKVKELHTYDKVVDVKLKKPREENADTYMGVNRDYVGPRTAAIEDHLLRISNNAQPREIRAILENAVNQKLISAGEFQSLLNRYVNIRQAEDTVFDQKLMDTPISKELTEVTPQQFFDDNAEDFGEGVKLGEVVSSVYDGLQTLNGDLVNYKTVIRSFKYLNQSIDGTKIAATPQVGTQKAEEYFNSSGLMSVLLYITAANLPDDKNIKPGLLLFALEDGALRTSGIFKGKDNKLYSLDESGFDKYFAPETENQEK